MSVATSSDLVRKQTETRGGLMVSRGRFLVYTGLGISLLIRLLLVMSANFPLNDGGMFVVMIRDVQASHFALPRFTDYNGMHIPFAYPPLAFYVAALMSNLTHTDPITILRILPLLLSFAAVGAFALLARSILGPSDAAVIATIAFSFLPRSVMWQVMGGGLTRGFGFVFALLALHQGYELFAHRAFWRVVPAALFTSLTVLSHPQMAWVLAYSLALFFFWYGRNRNGVFGASIVVVATVVLTSPWWITVIAYHRFASVLAAVHSGSSSAGAVVNVFLRLNVTGEALLPVLALLALFGIAWSVQTRQWMLPVWLAVMIPLDPRQFMTDMLLPVALLVGLGTVEILLPWLTHVERMRSIRWQGRLLSLIATCTLLYLGIALITACIGVDVPLSSDDRVAMKWVAHATPGDSQFLVLSGSSSWTTDRQAEWFPALTGRMSIATVQGSEWVATKPFSTRVTEYNDLQKCVDQSSSCLGAWSEQTGSPFEYVYVSETTPIDGSRGSASSRPDSPHHFAIEYELKNDPDYTLVFENAGAAIFRLSK